MWLILQQDKPDDFVVATGESYSVKEFVQRVFGQLDMDWEEHVLIDPRYFRPTEVEYLHGDPTKAKTVLGWSPKVSFAELVQRMVTSDLRLAEQERILVDAGHLLSVRGSANN
jgi:GDPmannose 4,6-dehydratase